MGKKSWWRMALDRLNPINNESQTSNSAQMWIIVDKFDSPVLVKFDQVVSYLPVFETEAAARDAARTLGTTNVDSVSKEAGQFSIKLFEWDGYRRLHSQHKQHGNMLFIYPMSKTDYGG